MNKGFASTISRAIVAVGESTILVSGPAWIYGYVTSQTTSINLQSYDIIDADGVVIFSIANGGIATSVNQLPCYAPNGWGLSNTSDDLPFGVAIDITVFHTQEGT